MLLAVVFKNILLYAVVRKNVLIQIVIAQELKQDIQCHLEISINNCWHHRWPSIFIAVIEICYSLLDRGLFD